MANELLFVEIVLLLFIQLSRIKLYLLYERPSSAAATAKEEATGL